MNNSRSLTPAVPTDAELHEESSRWRSEVSLWVDELAAWHESHAKALADLARVEVVLHKYAAGESKDREELAAYGQQLRAHEHALTQFVQGSQQPNRDDIRNQHQVLAILREEHRARHEETRQAFLALVTEMDAVRTALSRQ